MTTASRSGRRAGSRPHRTSRHVVDVHRAPFAGKQALAEMDDIEPQEACESRSRRARSGHRGGTAIRRQGPATHTGSLSHSLRNPNPSSRIASLRCVGFPAGGSIRGRRLQEARPSAIRTLGFSRWISAPRASQPNGCRAGPAPLARPRSSLVEPGSPAQCLPEVTSAEPPPRVSSGP